MESDCKNAIEIIPNQLYWMSSDNPPTSSKVAFYFNIDQDLVYTPFFYDFGPLNIGQIHEFGMNLNKILNDANYKETKIYHLCSEDNKKKSNAALLMCAFQIIQLKRSATQAFRLFSHLQFTPFRDASNGLCIYYCTIPHCLQALEFALKFKWYDPHTFNLNDYYEMKKYQNGDVSWIIPRKFIALKTPVDIVPKSCCESSNEEKFHNPEFYIPIFQRLGIRHVIRLNNQEYDKAKFEISGINHSDLYFKDGSAPSDDVVTKFLKITEENNYAFAVHCAAGLGRTGTLISLYAIKNYKISAAAMIAWCRLCRPGSILGGQQQYLISKEKFLIGLNSIFGKNTELLNLSNKEKDTAHYDSSINIQSKMPQIEVKSSHNAQMKMPN